VTLAPEIASESPKVTVVEVRWHRRQPGSCSLTLFWLGFYATMLDRIAHVLRNTAVWRAFDAVTGAVLVALGLRLATEPRP
jgi:arginine exporter protein ArgO